MQTQTLNSTAKYLSTTVSGQLLAIPVGQVKEIVEAGAVVRLPLMPSCILGSFNLRGNGVPVVDLSQRLALGQAAASERSCIVIVDSPGKRHSARDVGLLVDEVNEVFDLLPEQIEEAPSFDGDIPVDYMHGIGKNDGQFVVLLNITRLLDMADLAEPGHHHPDLSLETVNAAAAGEVQNG